VRGHLAGLERRRHHDQPTTAAGLSQEPCSRQHLGLARTGCALDDEQLGGAVDRGDGGKLGFVEPFPVGRSPG
jgi:hypothetical protein